MLQNISISGAFFLAFLLLPAAGVAQTFNYEFLQVDAGGSKTNIHSISGNPAFSGSHLNLHIQFLPAKNLYLKTSSRQTTIKDSNGSGEERLRLDLSQTTYDAVTGLIIPTRLGVDIRAGAGATVTNKKQSFSGAVNSSTKSRKTRFLGEAGLKFRIPYWGEVDLLYNRQNSNHYFIYESVLPLFRDIAFSSGYTYSPKSNSQSRYFAWNLGLKAYF